MFVGNILINGPKVCGRVGVAWRGFQVRDRLLQPEVE